MLAPFRDILARLASGRSRDRAAGIFAAGRAGSAVGWRTLVSAMPDAAVVLDAAARVLHANAPFEELYPDVKRGERLSRWLRHPGLLQAIDDAPGDAPPIVVTLAERLPVERSISARIQCLQTEPAGKAGRDDPLLLVTFRDLTEQAKLAQMREDLIANASHELRTPLASLRGFIETLQGPARDDPDARERFLGLMAGQSERMSRLIDDLLSLSRVEMREHVRPRGIVDMNEVAQYVIDTLAPMAQSASAKLTLKPADDQPQFRGERDEIVQVVSNLIHNAITYGGEGGEVIVEVSVVEDRDRIGRRIRLAVRDTGPGIAKEHLPRLTERFYRPSVAASRSRGGTGLGLAIVKHIIARHRGELEISSEVGRGSTFAVLFDSMT